LDQFNLGLFSTEFITEPTTYEDALEIVSGKKTKFKWKDAICKEFKEMVKRCAWEVINEI
jgi:hypothetical protein